MVRRCLSLNTFSPNSYTHNTGGIFQPEQRTCAILADPSILVLDEATSSVDTRTEARTQKSLLRLMEGRTSFVIAHRLSTIRDADSVIVIKDGEIAEQGTHRQLLQAKASSTNRT